MGGEVERGEAGGKEERRKRGLHRDVHFLAWELEGWSCGFLEEVCGRSVLAAPLRHLGSSTLALTGTYTFHMVPSRGNAAFLPMDSGNHCIRTTWDPN